MDSSGVYKAVYKGWMYKKKNSFFAVIAPSQEMKHGRTMMHKSEAAKEKNLNTSKQEPITKYLFRLMLIVHQGSNQTLLEAAWLNV